MKELIMRFFKLFGKHLFGAILLFITGALYFVIIRDGIDSFYYPMVGIFGAIGLTGLCILYLFSFTKKRSK